MRFGFRTGLLGAFALAWLAATPAAFAQDAVKIGVVDLDQAMVSTEDGKAARDELERKIREAEAQLQPMADELKRMLEDVEKKQFVLSEDAIRQKRLEVVELQNKIQNRKREIEGQLQVDQERLIAPIRDRLATIVSDLGRQEGFTLILHRRSPGVIYAREALDITDKVVAAYNKK